MKLLYYVKTMDGAGKKLHSVIQSLFHLLPIEILRTIESLNRRLRQPVNNFNIAVLLASSKEDLLDLLAIRDLFWNLRIILIIPDRKSETVAMGHMLRPRFLSYADGNFKDVDAVLKKMLERSGLRRATSKEQQEHGQHSDY
jgi:hypothetical protein